MITNLSIICLYIYLFVCFRWFFVFVFIENMSSKKKMMMMTSFSDDYIDILAAETNQRSHIQQQPQRRSQSQVQPPYSSSPKNQQHHRRNIHRAQIARHSHFPSYYTLNSLYSKPNFLRGYLYIRSIIFNKSI